MNHYDFLLQDDDEVKGKTPDLKKGLSDNIDLELYLVPILGDEKGYAKAVIAVEYKGDVFRYKYDTGRVYGDAKKMLDECVNHIELDWGLEHWDIQAREDYREAHSLKSWLRRMFHV